MPTKAAPAAAAPAAASGTGSRASRPRRSPAGASDETVKKMFPAGSFTEVPHDGMRKTIARRLTEAKQTIPHFYLVGRFELDALLTLREQINAAAPKDKDGKPAFKVSVNDFVIKALALALMRVPEANVTWTDGADAEAQACRCRRRGVDPGRPDHADRPGGRDQDAVGHLERDEGLSRPAPAPRS